MSLYRLITNRKNISNIEVRKEATKLVIEFYSFWEKWLNENINFWFRLNNTADIPFYTEKQDTFYTPVID